MAGGEGARRAWGLGARVHEGERGLHWKNAGLVADRAKTSAKAEMASGRRCHGRPRPSSPELGGTRVPGHGRGRGSHGKERELTTKLTTSSTRSFDDRATSAVSGGASVDGAMRRRAARARERARRRGKGCGVLGRAGFKGERGAAAAG